MEQFKHYLRIAGRTIKYVMLAYLVAYGYLSLAIIRANQMALASQQEELFAAQVTTYNEMLKINATNSIIQYGLVDGLEKAKAEATKKNDEVFKLLAGVENASQARDAEIINGVNGVVDSFNQTLSKPSYNYLRAITVFIFAQKKDDPKHGWIGTGVIVRVTKDATFILTNRHVMPDTDDMNYYVVEGDNKYKITAIKVSKQENVDLSLVKVDGLIDGKRAVIGIADSSPQEPVYMVGQNLGRPFLYAEGTVSGYDENQDNSFDLVVGMPSGPGNSGSGVINKDGKLIGLLYAGSIIAEEGIYQMDTSHGLCMTSKVIRLFLAGYLDE